MKKLFRIILCGVFFIGLAALIAMAFKVNLSITDNVVVTEIPKITLTNYFVPVSNFKDIKTNYTLDEFTKEKIVAINGSESHILQILPNVEVEYIDKSDLETKITDGYKALLSTEDVDFKYKTLKVDGFNFWDKSLLTDNYPFKTVQIVEMSPGLNENPQKSKTSFYFTGEIIPARAVDRLALNKNNNYTYMYDFFKDELESADISMGLLENPINGNPSPCTGCMAFVGDEQNAQGLKTVGFDVLSLAGNHAGDGGQSGFSKTIENLDKVEILHTGVGKNDYDKIKPAIKEVDGKRIGIVSADTVAGYYWNKGSSYWGTNWFSKSMNANVDYDRVKQLTQIKTDNSIDYLIAYMSWGVEYTNKATGFQVELAHALIDNGVDLVVGSHPHWVQNIEIYKDKPIIYSLGNFLFDQNHTDPTRQGMDAMLYYYGGELKSIELQPHLSCGPFISSTNITNDYLNGKISKEDLLNRNERSGCVYFQPLKLKESSPVFKTIWDRTMQHSKF